MTRLRPVCQATEDLYQTLDERRQLLLALADRGALLGPGDEPAQQLGRLTSAAAVLDRQVRTGRAKLHHLAACSPP